VARCHRLTRECVAERRKRQESGAESKMSYDDVEIEDMEWNEEIQAFTYPCPCGDLFQITKEDLKIGEEIARCPSCSLYITVIYNLVIWSRTLIEFFTVLLIESIVIVFFSVQRVQCWFSLF
jgi:diphthamide biosynthesis protein 3